jgi:hypothetical protein
MKRLSGIFLVLLAAGFTTSHAGPINLRWDKCWGDGGTMNANFACNTNSGSHRLVGSFISPANFSDMVGTEVVIDLGVAGVSLPAWWQFKNAGSCRIASLGIGLSEPVDAIRCVDWASGQALGGIASYTVDAFILGRATIRLASAVPASLGDILAGQEYFAFLLTLNHLKTVGAGSCAGCELGACIALRSVVLVNGSGQRTGLGPGRGSIGSDDRLVTWQGGAGVVTQTHADALDCPRATPVRNNTWGDVKALYR